MTVSGAQISACIATVRRLKSSRTAGSGGRCDEVAAQPLILVEAAPDLGCAWIGDRLCLQECRRDRRSLLENCLLPFSDAHHRQGQAEAQDEGEQRQNPAEQDGGTFRLDGIPLPESAAQPEPDLEGQEVETEQQHDQKKHVGRCDLPDQKHLSRPRLVSYPLSPRSSGEKQDDSRGQLPLGTGVGANGVRAARDPRVEYPATDAEYLPGRATERPPRRSGKGASAVRRARPAASAPVRPHVAQNR
jgi:hypothetical protein